MCRMAAYTGSPMPLYDFLCAPPHSLIEQAHAPKEAVSATVNADGIGIGWYADDGAPALYRSPLPAWADANLDGLSRSLTRSVWMANVRSATDPLSNGTANTQPFTDSHRLFLHNGFIADFARSIRTRFRAELGAAYEASIAGTTDSEYLFALIRQYADNDGDTLAGLSKAIHRLHDWLDATQSGAMCNIIVAEGSRLIVLCHAYRETPPSLYVHPAHPGFGNGALAASEPLDGDRDWQPVSPDHIVTLEPGGYVRTATL